MTKDETIIILEFYRVIDKDIKLYSEKIKDIEDKYYSLSSRSVVGGSGDKYRISDPTSKKALSIPKHISEERKELTQTVESLCKLKNEIGAEINALKYIHKYIILKFYIEKQKWLYISTHLNYSERQCKNIRNIALAKLSKQFEANKAIKKYKYPN